MASWPGSIFSPTNKSNGQVIDASHINDLQDEVVAIETGYKNGTAPLNAAATTLASLSVTGGSTLAGGLSIASLSVSGGSTFATVSVSGGSTFGTVEAGASSLASLNVSGLSTLTGAVTFQSAFTKIGGTINPTPSANQNNWNPTGLSSATIVQINGLGAASSITGISGGAEGRMLIFVNRTSFSVTFKDSDGNSSADCQIRTGGNAGSTLRVDGSIIGIYSGSRWNLIGP